MKLRDWNQDTWRTRCRKGSSGTESVTQQNGAGHHESSGWRGQELLTQNKPFPTLRFFFTHKGNSLVSQEAACLDLPGGNGIQAWYATCPGHLGLWRFEGRKAIPGTLSGLTSQKSVS